MGKGQEVAWLDPDGFAKTIAELDQVQAQLNSDQIYRSYAEVIWRQWNDRGNKANG